MKTLMLVAFLFFTMGTGLALAQNTPVVDERQQNQKTRIVHGVASGEVTRAEAKKLKAEQRHIKRVERRAKADGEVTAQERAKLQRKQNKASRDIRRQKNDSQDRPRAN